MVNSSKASNKTAPRLSQRRRLEVDERRKDLLELGVGLFGKYSYDELSIGRIAELAGISKGLLYHYFPTKRDYYVETIRAAAERLLTLTDPPEEVAPQDALKHGIEAYLDYVLANASAYRNLMRGGIGVDPEVAEIIENVRTTIVSRIIEQLGAPRTSAKQELALRGWVGFAEAASVSWLDTRKPSREEVSELLRNQLAATLAAVGLMPSARTALAAVIKGFMK